MSDYRQLIPHFQIELPGKSHLIVYNPIKDKETYEGDKLEGNPHGYGVIISRLDTKQFDGEFVNGKKDGYGVLFNPVSGKLLYEGDWKNDMAHGHGTLYTNQGRKLYEGDFEKHMFHGHGVEFYSTGQKSVEGEYRNNRKDGKCTFYNKYGTIMYEKEFIDGEKWTYQRYITMKVKSALEQLNYPITKTAEFLKTIKFPN